jgi:hypothetical protein
MTESGMSESARLVQRFLDQELSADERIRLVVELGRSDNLRREVVAMETLLIEAARLPRPAVPPAFVRGVLDRLESAHAPRGRHTSAISLGTGTPHPASRSTFWRPALAAAACALFAALGWLVGRGTSVMPVAADPSTVLVRLVVVQPDAQMVQVAGDFNEWNPARTPLEPTGTGAWTVTLPLEPGRYKYKFVVDGQMWMADPFAPEQDDDGFGSQNAVLDVRPQGAEL